MGLGEQRMGVEYVVSSIGMELSWAIEVAVRQMAVWWRA
jgi:hypothetical protein